MQRNDVISLEMFIKISALVLWRWQIRGRGIRYEATLLTVSQNDEVV